MRRVKLDNRANRGRSFEELIELANAQYRARGVAVVHKVPTAWLPLRDGEGRIRSAKVEQKAAVDFLGTYRGRPIAFDAKHCSADRVRWDRVEPHQAEFLTDWMNGGGVSFILVGFQMSRFFLVPWGAWLRALTDQAKSRRASIGWRELAAEHPEWQIPMGGHVVLDYLVVIDRLIAGEGVA
ncbi:MAG: Holliday junction resolvase RecU [Bacillota bacterium]|nr:Holliday junction resolvase RecU [Bacillota bacterium]